MRPFVMPASLTGKVGVWRYIILRRFTQIGILLLFVGTTHWGWSLAGRPVLVGNLSGSEFLGLIPMAVGLGGYSEVWGPLATIMVCGLVASSVLSLFLIPSVYIVSGDIKRLMLGRRVGDEAAAKRRYRERRRRRRELAGVPQMPARETGDAH